MTAALYALALAAAMTDWAVVARGAARVEVFTRAAVMLFVIAAAWSQTLGPHDARAAPWFLAGLIASLAGDVLLTRGARGFLPGVAAFALAQIAYVAGLMPTLPPYSAVLVAPLVALIAVMLFRPIDAGLQRSGYASLRLPVAGYAAIISLMLFAAWAGLFREEWSLARRLFTVAGATLFYASDAMLAYRRFVMPERRLDVPVLASYHLGQMALAASFAA